MILDEMRRLVENFPGGYEEWEEAHRQTSCMLAVRAGKTLS